MTDSSEILGCLLDCQNDAAAGVGADDASRIGTREVELVSHDRRVWPILKQLRSEGLIKRSQGYCWLTPPGRVAAAEARP